jgi:hypothetical protein
MPAPSRRNASNPMPKPAFVLSVFIRVHPWPKKGFFHAN